LGSLLECAWLNIPGYLEPGKFKSFFDQNNLKNKLKNFIS
jgi:hypothetical protein